MGSTGGGGSDPSQGGRQGGSEWDRQQGRSESERQQGGGGRPDSQQEQKGPQNRGQGEPGRDRCGQNSAMKRMGAVLNGGPPFGTVRCAARKVGATPTARAPLAGPLAHPRPAQALHSHNPTDPS